MDPKGNDTGVIMEGLRFTLPEPLQKPLTYAQLLEAIEAAQKNLQSTLSMLPHYGTWDAHLKGLLQLQQHWLRLSIPGPVVATNDRWLA